MMTLPFFAAVALKGALVLLLAALATVLLRAAPASARHGIWAAAFGALLLLPVLETVGPHWALGMLPAAEPPLILVEGVPMPPAVPAPPAPPAPPGFPAGHVNAAAITAHQAAIADFESDMADFEAQMGDFDAAMADFDAQQADHEAMLAAFEADVDAQVAATFSTAGLPQPDRRFPTLALWALGLWGLGAFVVGLGWLAATLAAYRLVALARPETDEEWGVLAEHARRLSGLDEPVRLLRSDALEVPIAWGLGRPAVVLPASADEWTEDRREAVLLHEMAHLRRRDAWTQVIAQVAVSLHWPNPLAWWGYRRFLDAREQACDDAVIQGGARPSAYAAHLVGVARALRRDRLALAGVAPMARKAPLEGRITSILDAERRRGRLGRSGVGGMLAFVALVAVPLGAIQPVAQATEAADDPVVLASSLDPTAPEAPEAPPAPLALVADTTDQDEACDLDEWECEDIRAALAQARKDAARALQNARRALDDAERYRPETVRIRQEALRDAEAALAQIDVAAVRADAARGLRESTGWTTAHSEARAAVERAQRDAQRDIERAMREAQGDVERAQREAEREQRDALREAQREIERAQRDADRSRREALRQADEARHSVSVSTNGTTTVHLSTETTVNTEIGVRMDSADIDWDAVDAARREAVRRSHGDSR